MEKVLFSAYSLDMGGIETALVSLINELAKLEKYDITLVLEHKQGVFLDLIDERIKIIEYTPSKSKVFFFRKFANLIKRIKFSSKYKNKFDCSFSYATYLLSSSFVARTASRNCNLWVHNNYMSFCDNDVNEYMNFFNQVNSEEFKRIIFVSQEACDDYKKYFKNNSLFVCNNLIDFKKIQNNVNAEITDFKKEEGQVVFLNVGRHDEKQKRLTRLIEAAELLAKDGLNFKILSVGSGPDTKKYLSLVNEKKLQNYFNFIGIKKNPYPYFNISDCVILTSEFEGFPVVYIESMILNKPLITTEVSDSKIVIKDKYGIVCNKDVVDIYIAMKNFILNGFEIKEEFNPQKFNEEILNKVEGFIGG